MNTKRTRRAQSPVPRSLRAEWEGYARAIFTPEAGPIQRIETRRAFYAGFATLLMICRDVIPDLSDDDGVAVMDGFVQECEQFCRDLNEGKV